MTSNTDQHEHAKGPSNRGVIALAIAVSSLVGVLLAGLIILAVRPIDGTPIPEQGKKFPAGVGTFTTQGMYFTFPVMAGHGFVSASAGNADSMAHPGNPDFTPKVGIYRGDTASVPSQVSEKDTVLIGSYETCNPDLWLGAPSFPVKLGSEKGLSLHAFQFDHGDEITSIIPVPTGYNSCVPLVIQTGISLGGWFDTVVAKGGGSLG